MKVNVKKNSKLVRMEWCIAIEGKMIGKKKYLIKEND